MTKTFTTGWITSILLILLGFQVNGQTPSVTTVGGTRRNVDSTLLQSQFRAPAGLAIHPVTGEIYVTDESNFLVRAISNGRVITLAGSKDRLAGTADGRGDSARFTGPRGLAMSRTGDTLWVADNAGARDARVRGILTSGPNRGRVFTLAGKAGQSPPGVQPPPSNNPIGTEARMEGLREITVGNGFILVAEDLGPNGRIRRIELTGSNAVTTLSSGGFVQDIASSINYAGVCGIVFSASPDSVFTTSSNRHKIWKISIETGGVDTIAGSTRGNADSTALQAQFSTPRGIEFSRPLNKLYVSEGANNSIRVVDLTTRRVSTLAGNSTTGGYRDSVGREARFNNPITIEFFRDSLLLVGELSNARLRTVGLTTGRVQTFAGGGLYLEGNPFLPEFGGGGSIPWGQGRLLIADRRFNAVRIITPGQDVSTFAGTINDAGVSPDSSSISQVRFNNPNDIEWVNGRLYIADVNNRRVMLLDTVAGKAVAIAKDLDVTKLVPFGDSTLLAIHSGSGTIRTINLYTRAVSILAENSAGRGDSLINPADGDVWMDTLFVSSAGNGSYHIRAIPLRGPGAGFVWTQYTGTDQGLNLSRPGSVQIDRFGTMYIDNMQQRGRIEIIRLPDNSRPTIPYIFNGSGVALDGPYNVAKAGRSIDLGFDSTEARLVVLDIDNGMVRLVGPLYQIANRPPSYTLLADTLPLTGQILEDSGPVTISNLIQNISANVSSTELVQNQTVQFDVRVDRPELFASLPQITVSGDTGTLTFAPAADVNGWIRMHLVARDNGGTQFNGVDTSVASMIVVYIEPVNDSPNFNSSNLLENPQPATPRNFPLWGTPIIAGPADEQGQILEFSLSNDNNALFTDQPLITYDSALNRASLSFTPSGLEGTAQVRVVLRDNGGLANGGIDSVAKTFTITFDNAVSIVARAEAMVRVMPNPAKTSATLEAGNLGTGKAAFELRNSQGKRLYAGEELLQNGNLKKAIPVGTLPNGLYVLKVYYSSAEATIKLQVLR